MQQFFPLKNFGGAVDILLSYTKYSVFFNRKNKVLTFFQNDQAGSHVFSEPIQCARFEAKMIQENTFVKPKLSKFFSSFIHIHILL